MSTFNKAILKKIKKPANFSTPLSKALAI